MSRRHTVRTALTHLSALLFLSIGCSRTHDSVGLAQASGVAPTQAQDARSFEIINEQITLTIAEKMLTKCSDFFHGNSHELQSCNRTAKSLADVLDFDYLRRTDGNSAFAFLVKRLNSLLGDPRVADYLNEVQRASLDALYANQKFNLWDFSLAHAGGDHDVALERLAVLFQDGGQTGAQMKYLLVKQHPLAFVLGQTVELLESGLVRGKIDAYPDAVQTQRHTLYHYYVPRYLARQLSKMKHNNSMATRLPFLFNTVYEMRQIQKTQDPHLPRHHVRIETRPSEDPALRNFLNKWNRWDEMYSDLLDHLSAPMTPFKHDEHPDNADDIYLGYVGALHGVKGLESLPRTQFLALFSQSPLQFTRDNIH